MADLKHLADPQAIVGVVSHKTKKLHMLGYMPSKGSGAAVSSRYSGGPLGYSGLSLQMTCPAESGAGWTIRAEINLELTLEGFRQVFDVDKLNLFHPQDTVWIKLGYPSLGKYISFVGIIADPVPEVSFGESISVTVRAIGGLGSLEDMNSGILAEGKTIQKLVKEVLNNMLAEAAKNASSEIPVKYELAIDDSRATEEYFKGKVYFDQSGCENDRAYLDKLLRLANCRLRQGGKVLSYRSGETEVSVFGFIVEAIDCEPDLVGTLRFYGQMDLENKIYPAYSIEFEGNIVRYGLWRSAYSADISLEEKKKVEDTSEDKPAVPEQFDRKEAGRTDQQKEAAPDVYGKSIYTNMGRDKEGAKSLLTKAHNSAEVAARATIETIGLPDFWPGKYIKLEGLCQRLDGMYYILEVSHKLDDGWSTSLQVIRQSMPGAEGEKVKKKIKNLGDWEASQGGIA